MAADPLRDPDTVERILRAALAKGDVLGVEAALRIMVRLDAARAERLFESLRLALRVANRQRGMVQGDARTTTEPEREAPQ